MARAAEDERTSVKVGATMTHSASRSLVIGFLFQAFLSILFYLSLNNRIHRSLESVVFYLVWPGWLFGYIVGGGVHGYRSERWIGGFLGYILNSLIMAALIYLGTRIYKR